MLEGAEGWDTLSFELVNFHQVKKGIRDITTVICCYKQTPVMFKLRINSGVKNILSLECSYPEFLEEGD